LSREGRDDVMWGQAEILYTLLGSRTGVVRMARRKKKSRLRSDHVPVQNSEPPRQRFARRISAKEILYYIMLYNLLQYRLKILLKSDGEVSQKSLFLYLILYIYIYIYIYYRVRELFATKERAAGTLARSGPYLFA
jgi:hypothetical protein